LTLKNKKKLKIYSDRQKTMKIPLRILETMKQMRHSLRSILKKKWRNSDHENLKIEQKFGCLHEKVISLVDDTNG
jgi:hypothetical protein